MEQVKLSTYPFDHQTIVRVVLTVAVLGTALEQALVLVLLLQRVAEAELAPEE